MNLKKMFGGKVQLRITSADPERLLRQINRMEIPVFQVERVGDIQLTFFVPIKMVSQIERECKKNGDEVRIIAQSGPTKWVQRFVGRPILLLGVFVLFLLSILLPTRILFVSVDGNNSLPDGVILEAAESCGIVFGAQRETVRSEKVKNLLLDKIPQLQWAGVNTYGCRAVICVTERVETSEEKNLADIQSIAASRDGIVTEVTALKGTALCSVGQAVQKGQILISGYTDCGLYIRAEQAEGEVYAKTHRQLSVISPLNWEYKGSVMDVRKDYSLLIGKKRINLWKDSGISEASCDRMYREYYVTLPGGFRLPIGVAVDEITVRQKYEAEKPVLSEQLSEFAMNCLCKQMVAGSIQEKKELFSQGIQLVSLTGDYECTEMIGRYCREEIGD